MTRTHPPYGSGGTPAVPLHPPPVPVNAEGRRRTVGVEIEFGGLRSRDAAAVVQTVVGGRIIADNPHAHRVDGTPFGTFEVKLDTHYAHPQTDLGKVDALAGQKARDVIEGLMRRFGAVVGDVARHWLPMEVVCPPVPWDQISMADRLLAALRAHGAEGTEDAPYYAFGLQLNPELPGADADSLRRHLQAYVLSADWLRARIGLDPLRQALPFVDPFPRAYVRLVLEPDYGPGLDALVDDYLAHNPTRNRELDMLPAFAFLRPDRVRAVISDKRIKPRPTFHYRLPNGTLSGPPDHVVREWNRWVTVERLAAAPRRLADLANTWRHNDGREWLALSAPVLDAVAAEG